MRAEIAAIPDGTYKAQAIVDSDGVVNAPLEINRDLTKGDGALRFDFSRSSPPCQGPMNSVFATTQSSVFLAMRHIFPDVPALHDAADVFVSTGERLHLVGQ